ncbi:MAG: bifunctional 4-hydroxy-2-oxoglutarate aldolase/2-dehydro-3-deoxy-phosphogluconate aldolase [Propioniciclava sp.]|uniref:bifunctional 4-hydroxy-2-oxoglutarate aldolase/2-dehydro-3-deoxy-phosphogluconate aldolase n=1 Tax=Propioniciclava sp. TaxID=2038686 RepID=UPI0039E239AE
MKLSDFPVIPVAVVKNAERADALGAALVEGGLPVVEVTLRTPGAVDVIRRMATNPGLLVGAGTVLTPAQVEASAKAGARFIVSPGFSQAVVDRARDLGLTVLPGAVTPTEIMAALDAGLTTCKFFPAHVYGGAAAIKALGGPFGAMRFVPTGGITAANLADYLALPNVVSVGGSWMVPADAVDAGDFAFVREQARAAVALARSLEA